MNRYGARRVDPTDVAEQIEAWHPSAPAVPEEVYVVSWTVETREARLTGHKAFRDVDDAISFTEYLEELGAGHDGVQAWDRAKALRSDPDQDHIL